VRASRAINIGAWALFAVLTAAHLACLFIDLDGVAEVTQPLLMPTLMLAVVTASRLHDRTSLLLLGALGLSWLGDLVPGHTPRPQAWTSAFFLGAMVLYSVTLFPLWIRSRDALKLLMAVPYAGVVIGLFIACAEGASGLLPLVLLYAVILAATAFLAAGVNAFTWMGGTLFLASSSLLGVSWFLPGAAIPYADAWVMLTYLLGQGLLVLGLLRTVPERRWEPACTGGSSVMVLGSS
jgi:hypothetical protein